MSLSHMWISSERVNGDYNREGQPCPYGVLGMIKKESALKSTVKGVVDATVGGAAFNCFVSLFAGVLGMAGVHKLQESVTNFPTWTGEPLGDALILSVNASNLFAFGYLARHNMKERLDYPYSPRWNPFPASERAIATRRNARLVTCGMASLFMGAMTYNFAESRVPPEQPVNNSVAVPQDNVPHVVDNQLIFRLRSGNEGCIEYVVDAREQAVRQNPCRQPVPNH